jgi:LysR family transcriptional regulator of gallate degradation
MDEKNYRQKNLYDFRNLWVLDSVAAHGSINGASHHLPLTQPAISRIIKLLEHALDVSIFERKHDGVVMTKFGEIVLQRIRRSIRYLTDAERALASEKSMPRTAKDPPAFYRVIKFRHLVALIEIANCQNTTIAARRIGVTQPAVYRSLRELEQIVAAPLFERRYRRMIPTETGETLLQHAKLALTELRYCENDLSARKGSVSGRVKIGILPLLQTMLVPQAVETLSGQFPGLQFSILDRPYETLIADLRSGDIDLIVGALREPAPFDDMFEEVLFTDVLSIVARAQHPLIRKKRVGIAQLATEGWIVPMQGTLIRDYFEEMFRSAEIATPTDLVESSSVSTIRALLLESDRLAIISRGRIDYEERSGILAPLAFPLQGTHRKIGITIRAEVSLPPGVEAFLKQLRALARRTATQPTWVTAK